MGAGPLSDCPSDNTIAEYLDGYLPQEREAAFRQHLDICSGCRVDMARQVAERSRILPRPDRAPLPLKPGDRVDTYEILEEMGAGVAGVVYAARDPERDGKVALKLLSASHWGGDRAVPWKEVLLLRLKAAAELCHENVVTLYDFGEFHDQVFVVTEFVEGTTLRGWLSEKRRSWREVLKTLVSAGKALAAAHEIGLVHGDFKSQNVLIGLDGRVRVTDTAMAMPVHLSPEQIADEAEDWHSDIFSFCAVLYEALYGEAPFAAATQAELRAAMREGNVREAPQDSSVPAWIRPLLLRGLKGSASQRHESMNVLLARLEAGEPIVGSKIGSYKVMREIGRGGMGVVYEAVNEAIGKRAAIKVLIPQTSANQDYIRRFRHEAQAASTVKSSFLVDIYDYDQLPDGTPYILMEYLDGTSLRSRLLEWKRARQKPPLREILRFAVQVASALPCRPLCADSSQRCWRRIPPTGPRWIWCEIGWNVC